jgi:hypothetical protein
MLSDPPRGDVNRRNDPNARGMRNQYLNPSQPPGPIPSIGEELIELDSTEMT